ncbi:MAG: metallophosphoesterase family protein [Nitrososphaerales archaeon]
MVVGGGAGGRARPGRTELAFISDVHSNLEALDAVLAEVGEGTRVYCLGDVVGYGASPNEVIARLRERGVECIAGNHDNAVLTGRASGFSPRAALAVAWTVRNVTPESLQFLASLPRNRTVSVDGRTIYMAHGSPDDNLGEYVYEETHTDLFGFYLRRLRADAIALGHTHIPFVWAERGEGTVFNPGSVGQPRSADRRAGYALLAIDGGRVSVELRRAEYDVERAARRVVEAGLPESLAAQLLDGA